jgi:hypothetical protein
MAFTGPAEDRQAIRELLDIYADAVTRRDPDDWGACWAEDARWEMPDYPEFPPQTGRANIVALWTEAMSHYPGIMFQAWPGAIQVEGDRATVRSYTTEVYDQDGDTVRDRGLYEDECVKLGGRWLFAKRVFRNIHKQRQPRGC